MNIENEFSHRREIERYGGTEEVGSALWLEHVKGIKYKAEDGTEHLLTPKDLANDEAQSKGSPFFELQMAMKEDASIITRESLLRNFVLRMLPVKIVGDKNKPPLIFNTELKIFTVPQELTVNPGVIEEKSGTIKVERFNNEGELEIVRDLTKEQTITFSLRLIPEQGYVKEFGYYPGGMHDDYGIGALEITPDLIRMQLHHRIYAEIYRKSPTQQPAPLIAPHQF